MKGLLFTFALTYGGAVVSLFKPYYGFLIYVVFANLRPDALWSYSLPVGNYSRVIAVAFLIGWLMNGMGSWNFRGASSTIYALLFFWAWHLLGAMITPAPAQVSAWEQFDILSKIFIK